MDLPDIILHELVDMLGSRRPLRSPLCIIILCIFIGNMYLFHLFVSLCCIVLVLGTFVFVLLCVRVMALWGLGGCIFSQL